MQDIISTMELAVNVHHPALSVVPQPRLVQPVLLLKHYIKTFVAQIIVLLVLVILLVLHVVLDILSAIMHAQHVHQQVQIIAPLAQHLLPLVQLVCQDTTIMQTHAYHVHHLAPLVPLHKLPAQPVLLDTPLIQPQILVQQLVLLALLLASNVPLQLLHAHLV